MKNKELVKILTASVSSLKKEGKFARNLMWKRARPAIFSKIYSESRLFLSKFVKIALVGAFLSMFEEKTVIEWIKQNWMTVVVIFIVYMLVSRLVSVLFQMSREKCNVSLDLEIESLIWEKNKSTGIGTRVGSLFRQKLRTARRCNYYDIKIVGLWPVEAVAAVLSVITFLVTLAFLNWRICVLLTVTASITAFVAAYMSRWVREKEKELQEAEDRAREYYPASLSIDSTFLRTCRALFGRSVEIRTKIMLDKLGFSRKSLIVTTLVGSLTFVALAVQLYLTKDSIFLNQSLMMIGVTVSTVGMTISSFTVAMRTLFGEQSSIEDVRELQEFLDLPDEEKSKDNSSFSMSERDTVKIVDAEFSYPYVPNSPVILRNLSIEFEPGEAVAIVGENGSGKTTMGFILSNIHRPQKGCVLYGTTPIGGYSERSVMEHALVIPQKGSLYDLYLSEALFGVMDMSTIDMSRYSKAIAITGAKNVLDRIPNGIHTQLGTAFKGGTNLSGGEEQRLRLAGFLYRALDPKIKLVLADEPSRFLDPRARATVYSELISIARDLNKIVLVISHDADLEMFDRVVVLEKGRVLYDKRGEEITDIVQFVTKRLAYDVEVAS